MDSSVKKPALYSAVRFRRAVMHFLGGRLIQAGATAAQLLWVVRLLTLTDYGAYMVIIGAIEFMARFASFGLSQTAQQFIPNLVSTGSRQEVIRLVNVLFIAKTVSLSLVAGVLWLCWPMLAPILKFAPDQIESGRLWIGWLVLLVWAFRYVTDLLEALLEQGRAQFARTCLVIGKIAALAVWYGLGYKIDLQMVLAVEASTALFCLMLSLGLVFDRLRVLPEGRPSAISMGEVLRFAGHMAGNDWLRSAASPPALRLIVAGSLGLVEAGMFGFLQNLLQIINRYLPAFMLRGLVRPILVSRYISSGNFLILSQGASLLWKSNLLVLGPAWIVVAVAGDSLVSLMSGGKFTHGGVTLLLLLFVLTGGSQGQVFEMIMQIIRCIKQLWYVSFLAPVILGAVFLVLPWGLNAVVMMMGVNIFVWNSVALYTLKKKGDFQLDVLGGAYISLSVMGAIAVGLWLTTLWGEKVGVVAALLSYGAGLLILRPLQSSELTILQKAMGKRLSRLLGVFMRA